MNLKILACAFSLSTAWSMTAAAQTSLELLHGWGYNDDFNGDSERTTLSIKTFQVWPYGTFFMYYDITGPFTAPDADVLPNEKGGFFGGTSLTLSIKQIGEKIATVSQDPTPENMDKKDPTKKKPVVWDWGALADFSLRYELEHVSKFGALHYYGVQFDFRIPHFDFVSMTASIRDDHSLAAVDLQLGGAWQTTIPIWDITNIVFAGFFSWGLFGEGEGVFTVGPNDDGSYTEIPVEGRPFFITQPQLMLDVGKLVRVADNRILAGIEYQFALNRYLQKDVHEHVPQLLFKWNL
jgi:hypothetical protein